MSAQPAEGHILQKVSIDSLTLYKKNSRIHSDEQINQICESIKEFGFTNPILIDKNYSVIAGHGRIEAAKKLGLKELPAIELSGLSEKQKKAYIIADNKLALNADWDENILTQELKSLIDLEFDLSIIGFDDNELNQLFNDNENKDPTEKDIEYQSTYEVVISCDDETEQESVYNKMTKQGYKCRVLSM